MQPAIVVVGSLNVDRTFRVPRLPAPGETLTALGAIECFGGKGANQAVAAARAGARVRMIGCVGNDADGARYREYLGREEIDLRGIVTAADAPSGAAFITVDDRGENTIVVNPGANHALEPGMIERLADRFDGAAVVLLQLECPLAVVRRAAEVARAAGARVILNPSPWSDGLRDAGVPVDVFIVNQTEARGLTGREPDQLRDDPGPVLDALGCETIVVTRGAGPTLVIPAGGGCFEAAPPDVTPVDSVGAGDTFAGAFAVALAEGRALRDAVVFANHAAALAVLAPGAQTAIPRREKIVEFMRG